MDIRSLLSFARIKPLAAWSLSAGLLGTALAYSSSSGIPLDVFPMGVAIVCVVLMQYVAHPMNDIMDLELDRHAPIASTGRVKPIAEGAISVGEAKGISLSLIVAILILLSYLILLHPVLIVPAAYGMMALFGYNHPSTRWAYSPFTELYLSMPINAISVAVIAFIGSGVLTGVTVVISIIFGFSSSVFFVTMMSMDFSTDRANGKMTTIASYPGSRYCAIYPSIGLLVTIIGAPVLMSSLGLWPAILLLIPTVMAFVAMAWLGSRADHERIRSINEGGEGGTILAGRYRLWQLYLSVLLAVILSSSLVLLEAF